MTTDHLGSPRVITDDNGEVISRRDFMPFGEELNTGVGARSESLKYTPTGSDSVRKRFTGYEKDGETQLDFAEARMYQNKHGRFTAVDPLLASASAADPQTFNRYTYTGNNPVNRTDPAGLNWCRNTSDGTTKFTGKGVACESGWENMDGQVGKITGSGCDTRTGVCHSAGQIVYFDENGKTKILKDSPLASAIAQGQNVYNETVEVQGQSATGIAAEVAELNSTSMTPASNIYPRPLLDLPCPPGGASGCGSGNVVVPSLVQGASADEVLDSAQTGLESIGMVPGLEVADAVSGLISLGRRDYEGAALSGGALFPAGGQVFTGIKWARRANKTADSASDLAKRQGIYEFPDAKAPGSTYVGQSGDMPSRMRQHELTGKKAPGTPAKMTPVPGGRTSREIAEHQRVQKLGGVRSIPGSKTSNIRNPIGKKRRKTLGIE